MTFTRYPNQPPPPTPILKGESTLDRHFVFLSVTSRGTNASWTFSNGVFLTRAAIFAGSVGDAARVNDSRDSGDGERKRSAADGFINRSTPSSDWLPQAEVPRLARVRSRRVL